VRFPGPRAIGADAGREEHCATPHLLTGIAQVESTYAQFSTRTLYGVSAKWPTENFPTKHVPGGTHIGLMQVRPADYGIGAAWNWVENTSSGVALFQQKLATAKLDSQHAEPNRRELRERRSLEHPLSEGVPLCIALRHNSRV
jgi:hypothetical protein